MKVITAPDPIAHFPRDTTVFLAGGITNCPWWQDELIELLEDTDAVLLNPRRRDFPIHDPGAAKEQITWEFYALNSAHIISMWFSNADSDQPICMYELGRHLARLYYESLMPNGEFLRMVVGVEPGYRREQDVRIQTGLVHPRLQVVNSLSSLADQIRQAMEEHQNYLPYTV